jgi:hypothetical protein
LAAVDTSGRPPCHPAVPPADHINEKSYLRVESQLTTSTGLEDVSDNDNNDTLSKNGGIDDIGPDGVFFEHGNDHDDDDDDEETGDINDYSADEYPINERTSHFMDRVNISTSNCAAVECVYMVEAFTLVRDQKQMKRLQVAEKVQAKYWQLITAIPISTFADTTLKPKMIEKFYHAKSGSASSFLDKVEDVIRSVRGVAGGLAGIGTPLHKIPSGKSLSNVKKKYILDEYKKWLLDSKNGGPVSFPLQCFAHVVIIFLISILPS